MAWILLTNDDGIEADSCLQNLVTALHERGHGCIVFANSRVKTILQSA